MRLAVLNDDMVEAPIASELFGHYAFDRITNRVTVENIVIRLTKKEFELALLLFRNLGKPLSRDQIHEAIWRSARVPSSRTLDTHVAKLRSKLSLCLENGYRLMPIYGYGYWLVSVDALPDANCARAIWSNSA